MNDSREDRFATHVHEVVDLHSHGASARKIEARLDAMTLDREEQSALWLLAFSLDAGAHEHRGVPGLLSTDREPELSGSR